MTPLSVLNMYITVSQIDDTKLMHRIKVISLDCSRKIQVTYQPR